MLRKGLYFCHCQSVELIPRNMWVFVVLSVIPKIVASQKRYDWREIITSWGIPNRAFTGFVRHPYPKSEKLDRTKYQRNSTKENYTSERVNGLRIDKSPAHTKDDERAKAGIRTKKPREPFNKRSFMLLSVIGVERSLWRKMVKQMLALAG